MTRPLGILENGTAKTPHEAKTKHGKNARPISKEEQKLQGLCKRSSCEVLLTNTTPRGEALRQRWELGGLRVVTTLWSRRTFRKHKQALEYLYRAEPLQNRTNQRCLHKVRHN